MQGTGKGTNTFFCFYFSSRIFLSKLHIISYLRISIVTRHAEYKIFRKQRRKRNDSFDARGIFKQFRSEEWGEYLIREAHLSQRFVFDENGYYHCCSSIPFPEEMQTD